MFKRRPFPLGEMFRGFFQHNRPPVGGIQIRGNRDVRGPLCGNIKIEEGRYASASPAVINSLRGAGAG